MSEQSDLTMEVRLNSGDMYRYTMTTIFRRFRLFYVFFAALAMYLAFQFSRADFEWSWSFGNIFAPLFFFILFPYAFFIVPYFSSKKYLQRNPRLAGPNTYTFSASGVDVVTAESQSHLNWAAIQEARETRAQFLLYPQTAIAHVIPRRCFANAEQEANLRNLLRNHVKKIKLRG